MTTSKRKQVAAPVPAARKIQVDVDINVLTFDDLVVLEDAKDGKATMRQVRDTLNRCVKGGVGSLPLAALNDIMDAINTKLDEQSNPPNATASALLGVS